MSKYWKPKGGLWLMPVMSNAPQKVTFERMEDGVKVHYHDCPIACEQPDATMIAYDLDRARLKTWVASSGTFVMGTAWKEPPRMRPSLDGSTGKRADGVEI